MASTKFFLAPYRFIISSVTKYARRSSTGLPTRSWFFPKQSANGLIRGAKSKADVIVLDLEDGVSIERKELVRRLYIESIQEGLFQKKVVFVRINDVDHYAEMIRDIERLSVEGVDGFLIPKVETTSTLQLVEEMVTKAEMKHERETSIKLVPIIETVAGYQNAFSIASHSSRNVGLIFGNHDFSAECMTNTESFTDNALVTRVVMAARAASIEPISGACVKMDPGSSNRFFQEMKTCGFSGSAALNETQVIQANREFSFSKKVLRWARQVAEDEECSTYQDTVQDIVQFIGPPHRKKASAILQKQASLKSLTADIPGNIDSSILYARQVFNGLGKHISVGETIHSDYEITITDAWRTKWQSSFLTLSGFLTSDIFASHLNLSASPLPFMLMKTLALSLLVSNFSERARVHLGCFNARQYAYVCPGDTVTASCLVTDARHVSKKGSDTISYTIIDSLHTLRNQNGDVVFSVEKKTMFSPLNVSSASDNPLGSDLIPKDDWKDFILSNVANRHHKTLQCHLQRQRSNQSKGQHTPLKGGDLLLHTDHKVFGRSETLTLCKIFKITNEHHHNFVRYSPAEILVPGPLVISAMISNSERETGHVVHEEIPFSMNINKVNMGDQISTITYIKSVNEYPGSKGHLEQVTLIQIGVINVDLEELLGVGIPRMLFDDKVDMLPRDYEDCCAELCPLLFRKIACKAKRVIVRIK